jgi:hypothetical protein
MMRKTIIITSIALLLGFRPDWAQNPNLGTAGAQFLKIPVSTRSAGMGGSGIGLLDDASAIFWNPAGIANLPRLGLYCSSMKWFEFFQMTSIAGVYTAGSIGTFALGAVILSMDPMEVTTEFEPEGTGRTFDAQDYAISLTYARFLTDRFRVGLTAKVVQQRIWNEKTSGFAFDIGTQYRIDFQNLTLAMSMRNFGPDLKMEGPEMDVVYDGDPNFPNRLVPARLSTEAYALPLDFCFGLAFDLFNSPFFKIRGGIDAIHPNDNRERIHTGLEANLLDRLYLRGGYKFNHDDETLSCGFGLSSRFGNFITRFDYAYLIYNVLPDVHIFSLAIQMDGTHN